MLPQNQCFQSILVVEDDTDIREAMVEILESEGYHTESATNGKEALELLGVVRKPCLILLDMTMPIMNGREFLDRMTKDAYLAPVPVLIVSAVADKTDTRGSIGFVKKPVDMDVLMKIVNHYCERTTTEAGVPQDAKAQSPRL